jgi:hypothetical protein
MTLSPVFRSDKAIEALRSRGVWDRLENASVAQRDAVRRVRVDLSQVLDARFMREEAGAEIAGDGSVPFEFVQEFFFLILFRSVLESVGGRRDALDLYSELNFCVQGSITAADNLFDDQQKSLLPLRAGAGRRFAAILELLSFQRLLARALDRGVSAGVMSKAQSDRIQCELLSRMAAIGALEGSEEDGIDEILDVDEMIERVHRLRGGALFELALVAPRHVEGPTMRDVLMQVEKGIAHLGTAFQIVDDLTDLEFDLTHRRQNLLVAQIHYGGDFEERAALGQLRESRVAPPRIVETLFRTSAREVLGRASHEARQGLEELQAAGFWFPPALANQLVRAIVGLDGVAMMKALSS